jgi:hypothetical protein
MRVSLCVLLALLLLSAGGWIGYRRWLDGLQLGLPQPEHPSIVITAGGVQAVNAPARALVSTVETFQDELLAYLHFEHFRTLPEIAGRRVVLIAKEHANGPVYELQLVLDRDLLAAIPYLAGLRARQLISSYGLALSSPSDLDHRLQQTSLFIAAYNQPVRRNLEALPASRILSPLARFLLFKSTTDRRIRRRIEPVPSALSRDQAGQLAADIVAVAGFFDLPLHLFVGIGAMENNYMNVTGDLEHAVWKKRAEPGDIVLKRRRGRVLVRNFSIGAWQITRETLRYAHRLFLSDTRDYSALPERLRPSRNLDVDGVATPVLTTYAGLLLRNLYDHFDGNELKAVAAYNGGPANPNFQYALGVATAAGHARRVLESAAALHEQRIAARELSTPRDERSTYSVVDSDAGGSPPGAEHKREDPPDGPPESGGDVSDGSVRSRS